MSLFALEGQKHAVAALRAALQKGSVHHAYLFAGPEGVGKEGAAVAFAQALLCAVKPKEGCGNCSSCQRVARFHHPDVSVLLSEADQVARKLAGRSDFDHVPSREIRVEQVRLLQERLSFRGLESPQKVALVLRADAMNVQAQNAFLKTLEEPPSMTVLVLVAAAPDKLLATLRSRCGRIQFGPLPKDLVARRVQEALKVDGPTAQLLATLAGGSVTRALELDVKRLAERKTLFERYEAVREDDQRTVLKFAQEISDSREDAEAALRLLQVWTRDLTLLRAGGREVTQLDLVGQATAAAARHSDEALHRRYRLLERTLDQITLRNASARLQVERMLLEMVQGEA